MQSQTIDPAKTALNYHHTEAEAHHEEHPDHRITGLIMFLVAEGMIFFGMFGAYLAFRSVLPSWPPEGTPELELLLPGVNTIILISSSFVMHNADTAIKKNDVGGMRTWLAITAAMGAIFLAGQLYEYSNLEFGLTTNLFASAFYVLTGFHGLHVFIGLVAILAVLWRSRVAGHYSNEKHFGVEAAEIYWHFVDVVWIVLFGLLYIL
ncbi:heme-copper oxidase subunit III [Gloeocapsopsis sp. IPPAS B-1203]|uniref:cytochrome c oxidase subunit 3 n=1 Tax=Gloeocapsopsis sp. IPPAS B-1203 TaxID=2049454 RepID=UPI000C19D16B|nr:heme-copper oxidase subunit III [Gloeocapsopsis sp. IPPAS B-1203]PIG92610.1 heme-copper oxidase subunit III [Gloeocapsopsis sp. IPPAS B-1203]